VYGRVRRMADRPSMGAKRDRRGGPIPPGQMIRLQQLGSCDDAMALPEVAEEVRLYRIIYGRYGGNEQREQPEGECQTGKSKAFPWQAERPGPSSGGADTDMVMGSSHLMRRLCGF
jgi:hypothetical protein